MQIPSEFYASVVGALIALGGVALSNRSAMKQLGRQLDHAASERRRQEESDLKRSVLLAGVDAIASLSNHLGRFADLAPQPQENPIDTQSRSSALAKVQLAVAGDTLRAVQCAAGAYSRAAFDLTLRRGRVIAAQNELGTVNQMISSGAVPQPQIQGFFVARDLAQQRLRDLSMDLLSRTMDRVIEFGEAALPVMLAFRLELGFELDEAEFRADALKTIDMLKEQKRAFIAEIHD